MGDEGVRHSRVDIIYATLLSGSKNPDMQELASEVEEALRKWETEKYDSHQKAELAVGVSRRLFGHNAPDKVIANAANILMSLGGSGLAAILQAVDEYDERSAHDRAKKVVNALMKKPHVLLATMKAIRDSGVKIAGPWEWATPNMVIRRAEPWGGTAARVFRETRDSPWRWEIEPKIGAHPREGGLASGAKPGADNADESLGKLGYQLVGDPLRDPEDFGRGTG